MFDINALVTIDFNRVNYIYKTYIPKEELHNFKKWLKEITGQKVLRVVKNNGFDVRVVTLDSKHPLYPLHVIPSILIPYGSGNFINLNQYF